MILWQRGDRMKINTTKNIAVVAAGIDEEYQNGVIEGAIACAREHNANISCFSAFGGVISNAAYDMGEYNIYSLINYNRFDGIILLTNTIGDTGEKERIIRSSVSASAPVAILDCADHPEFFNISIDNKAAMREIVNHVIKVHGARNICFISGPVTNPEANDRYHSYLDTMKENGLIPDATMILFSDFRSTGGRDSISEYLDSGHALPDVVICANDAMALGAAEELEKRGYRIPDDVIITGFDNTDNASHHYPALTTVSRPLYEAGYKACMAVLEPEKTPKSTVLAAEPVFTESCGCRSEVHENIAEYKRSTYKLLNNCKSDIALLNQLTTELAVAATAKEDLRILSTFIGRLGCERFCVCLCNDWEGVFHSDWRSTVDDEYRTHGYTKKMTAPLIWDKGSISSAESFSSEDMTPVCDCTGGNVSYYLPLHFRERCFGYYIITNSDFPLKSMLCHSLMMNVSNSVENIRKLLHLKMSLNELDRLYVMDPLCDIYNRNGFIRAANEIYRRSSEHGSKLMISFIDMDGLKLINDNHGHKEGDFALRKLAEVIKECSTGGRICARFGGDEFIILGSDAEESDIEPLEKAFWSRLESTNTLIGKPYEISASIGTIVTDVKPSVPLFSLITQADEIMYEQKKKKKTSRYLRKA